MFFVIAALPRPSRLVEITAESEAKTTLFAPLITHLHNRQTDQSDKATDKAASFLEKGRCFGKGREECREAVTRSSSF